MEKKHLKLIDSIKYILLLAFIVGCTRKNEVDCKTSFKEVIFKNDSFEEAFVECTRMTNSKNMSNKEILINFYINSDSDTIISFSRFQPYESVNLVGINTFGEFKLYFYAPSDLYSTLDKFVNLKNAKTNSITIQPIDQYRIDPQLECFYYLKDNKIIRQ